MHEFPQVGLSRVAAELAGRLTAPLVAHAVKPVDPLSPPEGFIEERTAFILGGGPGSGKKSTEEWLLKKFRDAGYSKRYIATIGDEARRIRNFKRSERRLVAFLDGVMEERSGFVSTVVREVFRRERETAFKQGSPFIVNHHANNPRFIETFAREARGHGYKMTLIAPHVDIETVEKRLENRKRRTERRYDMQSVAEKHRAFARLFRHYVKIFNTVMVLNNNGMEPTLAALARRGVFVGYDPDVMAAFMKKAHLNPNGHCMREILPRSAPALRLRIATRPVRRPQGFTNEIVDSFKQGPAPAFG
jgi:hypothetical protein